MERLKLSTMQTIMGRVAMCWDKDEEREENDA